MCFMLLTTNRIWYNDAKNQYIFSFFYFNRNKFAKIPQFQVTDPFPRGSFLFDKFQVEIPWFKTALTFSNDCFTCSIEMYVNIYLVAGKILLANIGVLLIVWQSVVPVDIYVHMVLLGVLNLLINIVAFSFVNIIRHNTLVQKKHEKGIETKTKVLWILFSRFVQNHTK